MDDCFIRIEDLHFSYDEGNGVHINVLNGISTEIHRGEYVAVIGHNGSGKSTFARLINMILEADSGKIFIDGKEITSEDFTEDDMFEVRRKVGLVQQNPDNQIVATIVEEDVAFGPENLGLPSEEIRRRVDDALATVGMTEYAQHEPHRLSGGQKQRVAIAGILAMMPECIIFDESTAMLDPMGRRDVLTEISKLNKVKGITIITITHYMNEAALADRVLVFDNGNIVAEGTPDEIFNNRDMLAGCGLDIPQSSAVALGLKDMGYSIEGSIASPELCAETIEKVIDSKKK